MVQQITGINVHLWLKQAWFISQYQLFGLLQRNMGKGLRKTDRTRTQNLETVFVWCTHDKSLCSWKHRPDQTDHCPGKILKLLKLPPKNGTYGICDSGLHSSRFSPHQYCGVHSLCWDPCVNYVRRLESLWRCLCAKVLWIQRKHSFTNLTTPLSHSAHFKIPLSNWPFLLWLLLW